MAGNTFAASDAGTPVHSITWNGSSDGHAASVLLGDPFRLGWNVLKVV